MSSPVPLPRPPPDVDTQAEWFLNHPDDRIFSAFFLGCVFMHGLHYLVSSSLVQNILEKTGRVLGRAFSSRRTQVDPEIPTTFPDAIHTSNEDETRSLERYNDHTSLIFVLNLCFAFAGLAHFLSLPPYPNRNAWETGCAFVVAWGGMAAQLGRLLGLIVLTAELAQIGVKRAELWTLRAGVLAGLGFVFASNATNTGSTRWSQTAGIAFCYRKHYLPTILASSGIRLALELYFVLRLVALSLRKNSWGSDCTVKTVTVMRACSLLILDLLTVVPDAKHFNLITEFIPFCAGTILVLAAFNWKSSWSASYNRSTVQSMIFVKKDPLETSLVATPFTLHFPREHRREVYSWTSNPNQASLNRSFSSHSSHSSTHSRTSPAAQSDMLSSVENAVLATASPGWRRSVKKMTFPWIPRSAPADVAAFSSVPREPGFARKILPHQAAVAAQLEKEAETHSSSENLNIVSGPVPPHMAGRQLTIAIRRDEDSVISQDLNRSPNSAIYGSDILQLTPTTRRADKAPDGGSTRSYRTSYESTALTHYTHHASDESEQDALRSAVSPRSSRSRSILSPHDSLLRSPWRSFSRSSFASARSKSLRDDLPTVREVSPDPGTAGSSKLFKHRSRRTTFGLPPPSPFRRPRTPSGSASSSRFQPTEPTPPLPAIISKNPPRLTVPIPTVQVLAPSNPGYENNSPIVTGGTRPVSAFVKGPRAPPSAWTPGLPRSPSQSRSNTASPSIYSQDTV